MINDIKLNILSISSPVKEEKKDIKEYKKEVREAATTAKTIATDITVSTQLASLANSIITDTNDITNASSIYALRKMIEENTYKVDNNLLADNLANSIFFK